MKLDNFFDSLSLNYSKDLLFAYEQDFHANLDKIKSSFSNVKYAHYIPILYFNPTDEKESQFVYKIATENTRNPNFSAGCLLFRLSIELATDKTNYEKEMIFSSILNFLGQYQDNYNNAVHYCLGFVCSRAAIIGIDISSSLGIIDKINPEYTHFFEEGFIDGISFKFVHILDNEKVFKLFSDKYPSWNEVSQQLMIYMYSDFCTFTSQKKKFNSVNCQSFFWMSHFLKNENIKEFIKSYSEISFSKDQPSYSTTELEKKYFTLQQEIKSHKTNMKKINDITLILSKHFKELHNVSISDDKMPSLLNQLIHEQLSYIQELEQFKTETEYNKSLKQSIKKNL